MKKNIIIVIVIVTVILLCDQLLKIHIKSTFLPGETRPLVGDWLVLQYIENQGMAFGTTFGSSMWAKLALSLFRVLAISGIIYYLVTQIKKGARLEFIIAIGLILAGATGNLIDSMFYDFIFPMEDDWSCRLYNQLLGSGIKMDNPRCGESEVRHTGFLYGNVVDMFQFQATWPQWVPLLGGKEVFPAIWNVADASISLGVIMVFFRQRKYFPKEKKTAKKGFTLSSLWTKKEAPVETAVSEETTDEAVVETKEKATEDDASSEDSGREGNG